MIPAWAEEETRDANLQDKRLNARLTQLLTNLGDRPTSSIPAACGGHTETVAAYRFFDNPKVTDSKILQPHRQATCRRMASQSTVLMVSDTTELDFTRPEQQVQGAGPMQSQARRGAFLHLTEAFTTDGTPLGAIAAKIWVRTDASLEQPSEEKRKQRKVLPLEEKESFRWLEGFREARDVAQTMPEVQCVYVADSDSDLYPLFVEPRGQAPVHWLIRACHPRRIHCDSPKTPCANLHDLVCRQSVLFTKTITVRKRPGRFLGQHKPRQAPRQSRVAEVEVRAASVQLRAPKSADGPFPSVHVNAVLVREKDPPAGEPPVQWLLLTTLPIDSVEQVQEVIANYTVRWMIEVLFRTLKSGCRVESRRFECMDRLLPCVAIYLIVAWRTLMLVRLGRRCPEMDCDAVFDASEWQSVWMAIHGEPPPSRPPSLDQMLRLIGRLGGYVNRKDPPGPQTIWLGLQRMRDLAWAWNTFGPGAKRKKGVV